MLGPGTSELTPSMVDPPRVPVRSATVRRQFDRRAARFAQADWLVREVGRRLIERLDIIRIAPVAVADIGCGLGSTRTAFRDRFPQAHWYGIDSSFEMLRVGARGEAGVFARGSRLVGALLRRPRGCRIAADAGALPLNDASVDLVYSNLMLHWHPRPHLVFPEWKRALRTDGLLLFSCFGPDTLRELRESVAATLPRAKPMPFVDMHDFGDMMVASGFATPVMDVEIIRLTFASPVALLREVSLLGGNPRDDQFAGLVSGAKARALHQELEARRDADGRIGVTFEVAYGHAWKPAPKAPRSETRVSVDSMRAQLRSR